MIRIRMGGMPVPAATRSDASTSITDCAAAASSADPGAA